MFLTFSIHFDKYGCKKTSNKYVIHFNYGLNVNEVLS